MVSADKLPTGMDSGGRDPDFELKGLLAQFTLNFLKGLMMCGIYPPDHPAIEGVAEEPYVLLKRLAPDSNEITFMAASAAAGDEIMVEGVLSEGIPFTTLMSSSMGEIFARKFIAYFERNQLVSFSVKTRIGKEEFRKLVSVFAERRVREEEGGGAPIIPFSDLLIERGILHVTAMARSEMVGGERPLPWRVKMAISRLRKDLRVVPLYSEATAQELAQAKTMLVQDITRPLRRPQFLKELLANSDLITTGLEELKDVDIEREIIWCQHPGMLVNVCWDIVSDLERASWGEIRQRVGQVDRRLDSIYRNLLKVIALRLREIQPETIGDLLSHLFAKKILSFKELPAMLQEQLVTEKWTNQFLANSEAAIERFSSLMEEKTYKDYSNTFQVVFPELVRRGHVEGAAAMAQALRSHISEPCPSFAERPRFALATLARFTEPQVLDELTSKLDSNDKEVRRLVLAALTALGEKSIGRLLLVLATSDKAGVRRDIAHALEQMGEDVVVPLMERLVTRGLDWFVYRNVIMMLTNLRCVAAADDVRKFLSHPHPRVREEAARSLHLLLGEDACPLLVSALSDSDAGVARRATTSLAQLKCRIPAFLDFLGATLKTREPRDPPQSEELVLAALDAVVQIGPFASQGSDIRQTILNRLQGDGSLLDRLLRKKQVADGERIRSAFCATLGQIGDEATLAALENLSGDSSAVVRQRTGEAITALRRRLRKKG